MGNVAGRELELKFELSHDELVRLDAQPMLREWTVGDPSTRTLRSIYFDTPDHRLRAVGISLRVRSDGEKWVQTVKSDTRVSNGVSHPVELEAVVGAPEPDLSAVSDSKLRRKLARLTNGSALEPIFETVVKRTARLLHTDAADFELALDEGSVRAGSSEKPLCEAELELKSGTANGLLETASKLFGDEPVRLAERSKADQGYDLATGRSKDAPCPARAQNVELAEGATCREALALFVQSATQQIIANRCVVLETDDPEGAHQLRIGLRRLRSALWAFHPLIDTSSTREMDQHARALARVVGELRDADVFIKDIYGSVTGLMKGHPGLQPLKEALTAHRLRRRDAARGALNAKHWSALQLYLTLWPRTIEEIESLDRPVAKFADQALNAAWKKVAKMGKRVAELEGEERHKMRKSLKKLRYAVEYFGSLYRPADVQPFVKQLKKLQDVFGYVNDVVTAGQLEQISEEHCRESRECQRAAGYIVGWHTAEAAHCWTRAENGWKRLARTGCFWG
jgi:triphosphatase